MCISPQLQWICECNCYLLSRWHLLLYISPSSVSYIALWCSLNHEKGYIAISDRAKHCTSLFLALRQVMGFCIICCWPAAVRSILWWKLSTSLICGYKHRPLERQSDKLTIYQSNSSRPVISSVTGSRLLYHLIYLMYTLCILLMYTLCILLMYTLCRFGGRGRMCVCVCVCVVCSV
jgi:hypothetical protein